VPVILTVLMSKPAALAAELVSVVALSALLVLSFLYRADQNRLVTDAHTIAQLQGAILNQNTQINSWQAQSAASTKKAQAALQGARTAGLSAEAKITALLNQPAPAPENVCAATDSLILEATQ
jgi:hypothetical protein